MKSFLVIVQVQAGEYQKHTTHLIKAETQDVAEDSALLNECHSVVGDGAEWVDGGIADVGYEFHYKISRCTEIEPEHVAVIKRYI